MRVSVAAFTGFLVVTSVGCSDFLNRDKSRSASSPERGQYQGPKRPDVNPLPPGFENPNQGGFSEEKMLVNIGVNVIAPAAIDFALETSVLEKRIASACQATSSANEPTSQWKEAEAQWKRAALAYHRVDSFPIGPLWSEDKKLAARIYSWPLFNSCGIDVETVRVKEGVATATTDLANPTRGLGAIEYLLFERSLTSRCNVRAQPQVSKWTSLPVAEKKRDRCALATRLAADLATQGKLLAEEWNPKGRNYTRRLIDQSDPAYPNSLAAINALTDSLFNLETVKDLRLGRPLGLHKDCISDSGKCPQDAEHPFSDMAVEAIEARLKSFGDAFNGQLTAESGLINGFGFDDFLVRRGHPEVAQKMGGLIEAARSGFKKYGVLVGSGAGVAGSNFSSAIEAIVKDECVASTSEKRQVEICALFQDVRAISNSLKAELLAVLALRAPPTYQGDND